MRTTLEIDADTLAKAARLTGVRTKTKLVRMGLDALIARESARKLAALGGSYGSHLSLRRDPAGAAD
jgi:Arc/MetJ family transcription regulator